MGPPEYPDRNHYYHYNGDRRRQREHTPHRDNKQQQWVSGSPYQDQQHTIETPGVGDNAPEWHRASPLPQEEEPTAPNPIRLAGVVPTTRQASVRLLLAKSQCCDFLLYQLLH
jgi:hypothetical protein